MGKELVRRASMMLVEARAYIQLHAPYFSNTVLNLVPVWREGYETLGVTDRLVCIIDPVFWVELPSVKMRASCLAHESLHILLDMRRVHEMQKVDARLANVAADLAINDMMLRAAGGTLWELPAWGCFIENFGFEAGLPAEAYFELLLKLPKEPPRKECGSGDDKGDDKGDGKGAEDPKSGGSPYKVGGVEVANKIFAGGCGAVVGETKYPELEEHLNSSKGRSPTEVHQIQRAGARELKKAAEKISSGRGDTPAYLEAFLNWEDTKPVVPWKSLCNAAIRRSYGKITTGRSDYSIRRPSSRSYTRGIIRPSLVAFEPTICYIEDSSGSMGTAQLKTSRTEFCSIMKQLGVQRAHFMNSDAAVSSIQYISVRRIKNLPVTGGGGTDFAPALAAAAKLKPKPDLVVYATDGDGYAPEEAPKAFDTIFLVVPSPWQRIPAPWGTTIVMSDDEGVRSAHKWVPE